jgi:hypothetical protein
VILVGVVLLLFLLLVLGGFDGVLFHFVLFFAFAACLEGEEGTFCKLDDCKKKSI